MRIQTGDMVFDKSQLEVPVASIEVVAGPAGEQFINDLLGTQVTGGSTSVRDAWVKLRKAGAEARARLMQAAADQWQVPVNGLVVADGVVRRGSQSEETLSYAQLAESAGNLPAPAEIPLKPNNAFTQIGQSVRRLDTPPKTDGTAQFGIDVRRPNQLYGSIIMCPVSRTTWSFAFPKSPRWCLR